MEPPKDKPADHDNHTGKENEQSHCIRLTQCCKRDLKLLLVALGQTGIIPRKLCTRLINPFGLIGE